MAKVNFSFSADDKEDADIIRALDRSKNKSELIRDALRAYLGEMRERPLDVTLEDVYSLLLQIHREGVNVTNYQNENHVRPHFDDEPLDIADALDGLGEWERE